MKFARSLVLVLVLRRLPWVNSLNATQVHDCLRDAKTGPLMSQGVGSVNLTFLKMDKAQKTKEKRVALVNT